MAHSWWTRFGGRTSGPKAAPWHSRAQVWSHAGDQGSGPASHRLDAVDLQPAWTGLLVADVELHAANLIGFEPAFDGRGEELPHHALDGHGDGLPPVLDGLEPLPVTVTAHAGAPSTKDPGY